MTTQCNEPEADREILEMFQKAGITRLSGPHTAVDWNESAIRKFWTGATQRIRKHEAKQTADGQEVYTEIEATSLDGETDTLKCYAKSIYTGDTYVVFHHSPRSRYSMGLSDISFGVKGPTEGKYRRDRVWGLTIFENGECHRRGPREVKVVTADPAASRTPQEYLDEFLRNKACGFGS